MAPGIPKFNKTERVKTPAQDIEVFKESINETMDKIYGRSFDETPASIQHDVVKEVLDKHYEAFVDDKFSNPFDDEKHAEKIVLELTPDEDDEKMGELLGLIHQVGLVSTLKVIEKTESYHVKDDLHRLLVQYLKEGYVVKDFSEKLPVARGLTMTLFEIYLPKKEDDADTRKDLKTVLSSMEQFYAGMRSVVDSTHLKNYFSVEIALPQGRDEIVFYCAVPDEKITILRSQLIAIFPGIKIIESTDDYNIFNKKKHIAGSVASLKKIDLFPIKLYEEFDYDPLNIILESFSSLEREEGASVQLMLTPDDDRISERIYKGMERLEKGDQVEDALTMKDSLVKGFGRALHEAFESKTKEEKEAEKEKRKDIAGRTDRKEMVEQLQRKNSGSIFKSNMRIVTAGNSDAHADSILSGIESAFNQFENPLGNRFVFERQRKGDLKRLIQDFTFRIFNQKDVLHLNTKELTTLLHFHAKPESGTDILKTSQSTTAGASFKTVGQGGNSYGITTPGQVLLGVNRHQGTENKIFMNAKDRLRHMYVIGQTGTGKSILLQNMIIQDIHNGDGCCFIDPHGSDIQDILANIPAERYKDVIYFDPANLDRPMGMNMLEFDPAFPEQKTFVVNELLSIFKKLYGDTPESMGPAFEQYFRNATMLVMEDPTSGNTMFEISRVLSDPAFRALKLARCNNMVVKQFWEKIATQAGGDAALENIVPYITNKFDVFMANDFMRPIIAQEKSAFNFRDVMDNKKILLINLSKGRLGELNSNMIGLIMVGKILMAALSRVSSYGQELPPFYLYIDEFQNVTTNSISQILSEARKYGLSLTVAHQFIKQLDEGIRDAVFGNVGSMATFRISAEDSEFMEKYYAPAFEARDIMNIENWNAYMKMLVNGSPEKPFNIATMPPRKGSAETAELLKKMSADVFGVPREEIESVVRRKYQL